MAPSVTPAKNRLIARRIAVADAVAYAADQGLARAPIRFRNIRTKRAKDRDRRQGDERRDENVLHDALATGTCRKSCLHGSLQSDAHTSKEMGLAKKRSGGG